MSNSFPIANHGGAPDNYGPAYREQVRRHALALRHADGNDQHAQDHRNAALGTLRAGGQAGHALPSPFPVTEAQT
jgi:hypothetical protein